MFREVVAEALGLGSGVEKPKLEHLLKTTRSTAETTTRQRKKMSRNEERNANFPGNFQGVDKFRVTGRREEVQPRDLQLELSAIL